MKQTQDILEKHLLMYKLSKSQPLPDPTPAPKLELLTSLSIKMYWYN